MTTSENSLNKVTLKMSNLDIYEKYQSVPDNALKPFDNGNFKGTDINTMWRIRCLTEQFGIVGFGWTVKVLRTWTEKLGTDEAYAFAEVEMKLCIDGKWGEPFTATGGNKLETYIKSQDRMKGNDEAFKMAITDAFGVLCKYIGIGADVYWQNDNTKYSRYEQPQKPQNAPKPINAPTEPKKAEKTANAPVVKGFKDELPFSMDDKKSYSEEIADILVKQEYIDRLKTKMITMYGKMDFNTLNETQYAEILKMAKEFRQKKFGV